MLLRKTHKGKVVMWDLLFVSVLVGALFLYVPGFALFRSLGIPWVVALICAPLVTSVAYSILGVVYARAGIQSSWVSLVVPLLFVAFGAFLVARFVVRVPERWFGLPRRETASNGWIDRHFDVLCLVLYVVVGLVLAAFFFLGNLDNAGSFSQEYDNIHHLGLTRSFLDSGNWSSLSSSLYVTSEDVAINPLPGSGFYPAAWNVLAALISSALGVPVEVSSNALNYLFVAVVFPSSMFLLMRGIFRDRPSVVPFGAFCVLGFTTFPWGFLVFGPLYPNMIAFSLVPAVAFCFMALFFEGLERISRVALAVLLIIGLSSFAFMQPNAVFTLGVLLAPFCVYQAVISVDKISLSGKRRVFAKVLAGVLTVGCIAVLWYAAYRAPFLQSVVTHWWPSFEPFSQSFLHALLLSFQSPSPQIALAVLVVAGGVYTLFDRRYLWVSCSYVLACVFYMVDASSDGPIKFLLTGFWYTDSNRVAAFAAMFAVPLASMGLWLVAKILRRMADALFPSGNAKCATTLVSSGVAVVAFLCLNYYSVEPAAPVEPGRAGDSSAFGALDESLRRAHSSSIRSVYDNDERAFVQEAERVIPPDALIVNVPDDGSAFAYGVDGARMYYRLLRTYGEGGETEESQLIRNGLSRVSSDDRVRRAVDNIGADYVLVLDQGPDGNERRYLFTYEGGRNWKGIESIDDDTPGFETVLSDGDMRLYRIEKP